MTLVPVIWVLFTPPRGIYATGANCTDLDACASRFVCYCVHKANHPMLACHVTCLIRDPTSPCNRGDGNDATTVHRYHVLKNCMGHIHSAFQVNVDYIVNVVDLQLP